MRAVFGVVALDAGEVRWRGEPVTEQARRQFGYMPEERGLYPGMPVLEQLEYLGRLHDMTASSARRAAQSWITLASAIADVAGLSKLLGELPPTAPVAMPVLYAAGDVPAWQAAISAAGVAAGTVWMARTAAMIYGRSILRTGSRVRLRQVLGCAPG